MKVAGQRLAADLKQALRPAYLIAGDETLLVQEALLSVIEAAKSHGFTERNLHVVERGFDWSALLGGASNLSLFSERRILDIRLNSCRPGDKGGKALRALVEDPDPDRLLVVTSPKQDSAAARAAWTKAFEKQGLVVQVWPLERNQLPGWVAHRMKAAGLRAERTAAEAIADRTEGNLLAAAQEVEKLKLLYGDKPVDEAAVEQSVADSARFDVFRLSDEAIAGRQDRAMRMLNRLRQEGAEPVLVLWSLTRDINLIAQAHFGRARGASEQQVLQGLGVWRKRQPLFSAALRRIGVRQSRSLVEQCAQTDRIVKGMAPGRPWDALTELLLGLAGSATKARSVA